MKPLWIALLVLGVLTAGTAAWLLSSQPPFERQSLYVRMTDGTRLAVDVYLPAARIPENGLPTVMMATRYWRSYQLGPMGELMSRLGVRFKSDPWQWTEAGYALVTIDVRGSGASFGDWDIVWSPQEVADLGEVVDWIVSQSWSNGRVGAFGVSYDGNAAELLTMTRHPAVMAVAPQYSDFDVHRQLLFPGGIYNRGFIENWDRFTRGLDANDPCALAELVGESCDGFTSVIQGVRPVDDAGDLCGTCELAEAVAGHRPVDLSAHGAAVTFADDPFGESGLSLADVSPYALREPIEASGVPMFVWASWLDGASAEGALCRFATFGNRQRLIIGPWSHGGEHHVDPFLPADTPVTPSGVEQFALLSEFFDGFLRDQGSEEDDWQITYYTLGEGAWKTSAVWPPQGFEPVFWYFGDHGSLTTAPPTAADGSDAYVVDWTASTGTSNRWRTGLDLSDVVYPDRSEADRLLLTYTSDPLGQDTEITGTPVVQLHLSSTHDDGALHVYLEDVAPDGCVTYITEGLLRLSQRAVSDAPLYIAKGPFRTHVRADANPLEPGQIVRVDVPLLSTSVLIREGHAIRVAIAGHDASAFARVPEEGTPTLTVERHAGFASRIILPTRARPTD